MASCNAPINKLGYSNCVSDSKYYRVYYNFVVDTYYTTEDIEISQEDCKELLIYLNDKHYGNNALSPYFRDTSMMFSEEDYNDFLKMKRIKTINDIINE